MKKTYPTYKQSSFRAIIKDQPDGNKKIAFNHPGYLQMFINNYKPNDQITITITEKKPLRTIQQRNYYWLYLSLISKSTGYTPDEFHSWVKGKFLSKGITEIFGSKVRKVKSTTELSRPEFCELICRIEDEAGIPAPKTEPFLKPLSYAEYAILKEEQLSFYERMKSKFFITKKDYLKYESEISNR